MQRHGSSYEKVASFVEIDDFSCFFTKWGTVCIFFLKTSSKCQNMVVCSKSCKALAKSMIFRALWRNEALFATFCWKLYRNAKHGSFLGKLQVDKIDDFSCFFTRRRTFCNFFLESSSKRKKHCSLFQKLESFGQINDFSCCFTKWGTFCNFFPKSWSKCKDMVVCSKKLHSFGQIDDFSCFSTEWGAFCNFLLKSSWKCQDMVVCSKSWKFWPNRWFFVLFHEMRHFLQLFPEKYIEMQRHGSLFEKLQSFGQIDDFSCSFTKWGTFCNFFLKSWSKCKDMVVCSKSCKVLAKSMIFRAFSRIEPLFATFCWKVHRNTKTW